MRDPPGRCYLSLLTLGTSVHPHAGPTNHRLRLHLPIVLPQTELPLGIVVGGERRSWKEGKCLLFDDSFVHSVDLPLPPPSDGAPDAIRVVFVADLWHPDAEWLVPECDRMPMCGVDLIHPIQSS
jgi:aspartyl/asparaginyl beta-hydroxylase (cupin superfamily)